MRSAPGQDRGPEYTCGLFQPGTAGCALKEWVKDGKQAINNTLYDIPELKYEAAPNVPSVAPSVTPAPVEPSPVVAGETTELAPPPPQSEEDMVAELGNVSGAGEDAHAQFTSISREVEIHHQGDPPGTWYSAKPDSILRVGDVIRTGEDSETVIGFADLTTFKLKPESIITISKPPSKDSKIGLILGNIWVNLKKLPTNGTLEVDMSQAVAGIKGTTFVATEDRKTSTLKVIEGTVQYAAKATGQTMPVSGGEATIADANGLSPKASFDVADETASWASIGASTSSGRPLWRMLSVAGAVVVCVIGVLLLALHSKKKKN